MLYESLGFEPVIVPFGTNGSSQLAKIPLRRTPFRHLHERPRLESLFKHIIVAIVPENGKRNSWLLGTKKP